MGTSGTKNFEASAPLITYALSIPDEHCKADKKRWEEIADITENTSAIMRGARKGDRVLPLLHPHGERVFLWLNEDGKEVITGEHIGDAIPEEIRKLALTVLVEVDGIEIRTDTANLITTNQETDVIKNGKLFHVVRNELMEKSKSTRQAILTCLFAQFLLINDVRKACGIEE